MPVSGAAAADFERLTRRHAVKLVPSVPCSVEEAGLAVGEVVGCECVKSASRMNGAIVIFLDATAKVSEVVEQGVVIQGTFTPVLPLVSPAAKVVISNAPPFIKNEDLTKELSRYGQLVSTIKMVSLGCKSARLKHVVSHRRQVFMVLKDPAHDLNLSFSFGVDGYNYMVFATSETMKCFGCGVEGHLIRSCPERGGTRQPVAAAAAAASASAPRGGEPPRGARFRAAAVGEPPQAGRSEAAAGGEPPQLAASGGTAGGEPPQLARPEGDVGGEPPRSVRPEVAAGGILSAAGLEPLRSQEAVSLEVSDPGEAPLICFEMTGTERAQERDEASGSGEGKSVNNDHVTAEIANAVEEEEMVSDDDFRVSQKRKSSGLGSSNTKVSRRVTGSQDGDSDFILSQESHSLYTPNEIKKFLEQTKGQRLIAMEDHFPDLRQFLRSAKPLTTRRSGMADDVLSDQEIYRLKKHILRVKGHLSSQDDEV